jgi:ATP-dependent DNA ligase
MASAKNTPRCFCEQRLPEGPDWLYELKPDGYRAIAAKAKGRVRLSGRAMRRIQFGWRKARVIRNGPKSSQ